ncbi:MULTISPECIES: haloacid dehalogenase type II [unclassified Rhizobium]|jgi:2-haloacid dehalogenase|uniref:haloacid dehalogenase type II n=1 Tax=unclassified Rhizobium TaxID=2613769 RepID=UPI000648EC75|nr:MULTISPECIES: haloacid dehalogenase type II [unclassified Rhizobium]OJY78587.1 MAG: haloacid dehalogenase, type II [Rhizobium sp. 60-20]RKD51979.1 2-haloacid dehalogenase [Rhizobium sp. WW_1]
MTKPRALLFDTFGTIVDWRTSLIDELTAFGLERGVDADWTGLVDAWRGNYVSSMDEVRKGLRPWTKLDDLHRATLDKLVAALDISGLSEGDLRHINKGWHRLRPWPDSVSGLTRLKQHFIIAPLSNGNVSLLLNMAKHAGLPWDMIFGSDLFHYFKPDRETYLGACELLDLEPGQVMLCAAHNSDLRMAASLGLRTAFIARPTEYGPHQNQDFEADGAWDFIVTSVESLADQLTEGFR